MLTMGCNVTKDLSDMVYLPKDKTTFDQNYNQREPLLLKSDNFRVRLDAIIEKFNNYNSKYRIKKPKNVASKKFNK